MTEEIQVLCLVAKRLDDAGIAYMVTGSFAVNFYATPRMTRDIDLVIDIGERDVFRMISLFKKDFYIDRSMIEDAIYYESSFNIIQNEFVVKVDCFVRKSDEYGQVAFARRRKVKVDSEDIWMISSEDLVISKLWWAKDSHSERQLTDIRNIMGHVAELDRAYIEKWVQRLGLAEIYGAVA